jgi:aldose 1-epimerase
VKGWSRIIAAGALVLLALAGLTVCKGNRASLSERAAVGEPAEGGTTMDIQRQAFGRTPDGAEVEIYALSNDKGLRARVMTYGATLVSLEVPDRTGKMGDIVLGYDALGGYLKSSPYFGSIVGRYGNRIAKGMFTLDGTTHRLATNNGENHLHGGIKGFDKVVWRAEPIRENGAVGVKLRYFSRDGEEGYPGNLAVTVVYTLTNDDVLKISYEATTDRATPVNLTHHSYFNLAGEGDVLGHVLTVDAEAYTPVDAGLIPTGEIRPVHGSPFDFTSPHTIGERIARVEGGYDHNFVLRSGGGKAALVARVVEPASGRIMEISTTEPGLQFYSGNFLDGTVTGKGGKVYQKHAGFCLETQHFPDSPNKPHFPSTILRPGESYKSLTIHKFSAS